MAASRPEDTDAQPLHGRGPEKRDMAIFREVGSGEIPLGVGGRITIPHEIRENMRLLGREGGDTKLNYRVEETRAPWGIRYQLVLWEKPASDAD